MLLVFVCVLLVCVSILRLVAAGKHDKGGYRILFICIIGCNLFEMRQKRCICRWLCGVCCLMSQVVVSVLVRLC